MTLPHLHWRFLYCCLLLWPLVMAIGCGTTKMHQATEQLLVSDAVDQSVAELDFSPLAGKKVYLDTQFLHPIKGIGFVNSDYVISSLREQMFVAGCRLQEKPELADYIVEARVGALGTDMHDVTYGLPATNALSSAAVLMPNAPPIPTIPEIALGKRHQRLGAAKIGVFAYERESRQATWRSGISRSKSTASDVWVLGAGPFQRGTIYESTQFAGTDLKFPLVNIDEIGVLPRPPVEAIAPPIRLPEPLPVPDAPLAAPDQSLPGPNE